MSDMDAPVRPDSPVEYYPVKYVEQYKQKIHELHLELAKAQDCNALFDENKRLRMRIAELEQEKRAREATEAWETSLLRKQATQGYMYQNPESRLPSRSKLMTPMTMAMEVTPLKPPGSPSKMVTVTVGMPEPLVNGVSSSSILNSFGGSPKDLNYSSSSGVIIKPIADQITSSKISQLPTRAPISSAATRRISAPITSMSIEADPLQEHKFVPHMPSANQPLLTTGVGLKPMSISAPVNLSNSKPRVAHQTSTTTSEPELLSSTDEPLRMTGVVLPSSLINASQNSTGTSAPARTVARQNSKPEQRPTPPKQPQRSLSAVVSSLNNKRKASSESNNPLAKLKKRALSTAAKNNQPVGIFKPEPKKAFSEMFSKEIKKAEPTKKPEPVKKIEEPKKKPARKGRSDEWIAEKIKELIVKYDYDFDKIPAADFITKAKQCQYSKNLCMKRAREMIAAKKKEDEEKEEEEELDNGAANLDKLLGLSASDSSSSDDSSSSESEDEEKKNPVQKNVSNSEDYTKTVQDKLNQDENDVIGSIFKQVEQRPEMVMTPIQNRPVKTGTTAPLGTAPILNLDKKAINSELASASSTNNSSVTSFGEIKSSNDQKATNGEKSSEVMEVDTTEKLSEEEEADIHMKIAQVANEDNEEKKRRMSAALIDQCGLNLDSDESDDEQGSLEIAANDASEDSAALAIDEDSQSSQKSELFIDDPSAQVPTA